MAATAIKGMNPLLSYVKDLISLFSAETISIPKLYREKVLAVKDLLNDDPCGLTAAILDMAITSAIVQYRVDTDNTNLTDALNKWLGTINQDLRGKIPTGLDALAKEYFRERWKGSSNLLLRTFWTKQDGLELPTTLFFVDGEDIKVDSGTKDGMIVLGQEKYYLKAGQPNNMKPEITDDDIPLPKENNEMIFVQKPFETWGTLEPVPFIIKRGIYRNSKFLELLTSKGEFIVAKALEYLLIIKKGSEKMLLEGNISYSKENLLEINQNLKDIIARKRSEEGAPTYTTQFDTDFSDYIPDYKKVINNEIYGAIEKRIIAGLGLIEIQGGVTASTRREATLNPKPLIAEVNQGVQDFKSLIGDVVQEIIARNKSSHRKWMSAQVDITSTPVRAFMDKDAQAMFRSLYDRGLLSKRTLTEIIGDVDFDLESQRREQETALGLDDLLYPPVVQNQEQFPNDPNGSLKPTASPSSNRKLPDRTGPEAKNFNKSDTPIETAKVEVATAPITIPVLPIPKPIDEAESKLRKLEIEVLTKKARLLDKLLLRGNEE